MSALRKSLGQMTADRMVMAIKCDDLIEAVNIPLRARRGHFAIDYTGHTPGLYLAGQGCAAELLATVDTRRQRTYWARLRQQPLQLMFEDIERRLAAHGTELAFFTVRDRQGRRVVKLHLQSRESRHIALWLAKVPHKQRQDRAGPFVITEPTTTENAA